MSEGAAAVEVSSLPSGPGVYLFWDDQGRLLYVGKAKDIRRRVRSYFRPSARHGRRLEILVERTVRVETVEVASEHEALVREAQLIKERHPPFNIRLRDDKTYPLLRISTRGRHPGATLVRERVRDGSKYFGPCTRTGAVREALDVLRRIYTVDVTTLGPRTDAARTRLRRRTLRMAQDLQGWLVCDQPRGRRRLERALSGAARRKDFTRAAALQRTIHTLDALACRSKDER